MGKRTDERIDALIKQVEALQADVLELQRTIKANAVVPFVREDPNVLRSMTISPPPLPNWWERQKTWC